MKPPPTLDNCLPAMAPHTVHVATRITDEVFSFIGPATQALVDSGAPQTVVFFDDPATHGAIERFDHRVNLQRVAFNGVWAQGLSRLRKALQRLVAESQGPLVIHLHGVLPLLSSIGLSRHAQRAPQIYFSPHSSRLLGRFKPLGDVALWAARCIDRRAAHATIASLRAEARNLPEAHADALTVIESPIGQRFVDAPRQEAQRALIVGGTQSRIDDGTVEMFSRFAVLLADTAAAPEFVWFGETNEEQRQRLAASGVRQVAWFDENTRAEVLSRAWIYLAPAGGRGVPLGLQEAMACSVACVVAETDSHNDVVTHLRSGLVYRDEAEALVTLAQLIDQASTRHTIGRMARREALRRFDLERFNQRLLRVYGQSEETRAPQPSAAPQVEPRAA